MKEEIIDGEPHVLVPKDLWESILVVFSDIQNIGE